VDEKELNIIDEKAKAANLKRGQYLRKIAVDGYIFKQDLSNLRLLTQEINKIGVNINQIAKHTNEIGGVYFEDIEDIKRKMDEIWQLLKSTLLKKP